MMRRNHQPHALPTAPLNRPCYQAPYVACRPLGPISPAHPPGLAHASVYVLQPDDVDDDDGEGVLLIFPQPTLQNIYARTWESNTAKIYARTP